MPDGRKISTTSLRNQDGNPHPRVRRFGGDPFGNKRGGEIIESADNTVVWLSEFSSVGFWISNQIRIFDISLKGFNINGLQVKVCHSCGTVWLSVWIFKPAITVNVRMTSNGNTERESHPSQKIMRSTKWQWMWVGKLTYWFISKDSKNTSELDINELWLPKKAVLSLVASIMFHNMASCN